MADPVEIRLLREDDPEIISESFRSIGWRKPVAQYQRYLAEQRAGTRVCFVALLDNRFAGYVTVNRKSAYPSFGQQSIPEIQDLNVLPPFRNRGIATRLLNRAEQEAARHSTVVGIGVGLHRGYGSAQRLYTKRGYVPDGRGVWYRDHVVEEGMQAVFDDDLVLHFTKQVR